MRWYKKALLGAGLLGLTSLVGCKSEPIKPESVQSKNIKDESVVEKWIEDYENRTKKESGLKLYSDGEKVRGKIDGFDIFYCVSGNEVRLTLGKGKSEVVIDDGDNTGKYAIDGNINYLFLKGYLHNKKSFFYKDNGDNVYEFYTNTTGEEAKKLREWANKKLKKVYEICREKFRDRLKIPYKVGKIPQRSLDEVLKDFDF